MGGGPLTILQPTDANIHICADAIRRGELVVMPTETVYGLAANALDSAAVRKIFAAKGRPADNPLIVHLPSAEEALGVASVFPESAVKLAAAFWPGPLTLVLPKRAEIPDEVTASLDTVALRVPRHPVARALLQACGLPLCAPSANRFMSLSPTRAEDVDPGLSAFAILDGGSCEVGIESTVVDLTGDVIRVLRPGRISLEEVSATVGERVMAGSGEGVKRSPGMYRRHYAPETPLVLVDQLAEAQGGLVLRRPNNERQIQMPHDPQLYAARLYAALHDLDREGLGTIYVERPPEDTAWAAVWDRLRRASGGTLID